jgi:uncharacterized protein
MRKLKLPVKNPIIMVNESAADLRIREGKNPLEASAVHLESYPIVEAMARDLGVIIKELTMDRRFQKMIDLKRYVTDEVGMPTLNDILSELSKPGRDPCQEFEVSGFAESAEEIADLKIGMSPM